MDRLERDCLLRGCLRVAVDTGSLNLRGVLNRESESLRALFRGPVATVGVATAAQRAALEPENFSTSANTRVPLCYQRVTKEPRGLSSPGFPVNYLVADIPRFLTWLPD